MPYLLRAVFPDGNAKALSFRASEPVYNRLANHAYSRRVTMNKALLV